MRMRWARVIAGILLSASCTVPVRPAAPADVSSALPNAGASGSVQVTVPGLPAPASAAGSATPAPGAGPTGPAESASAVPSGSSGPGSALSGGSSGPAPTTTVRVAGCPSCTVLATHTGVAGGLTAALLAAGQGRAVLAAVRGDGSTGSVVNVTYGDTFPTPPGGVLPCDDRRCVVIGLRTDGHAVASAWLLGTAGTWSDVTPAGGFVSATAVARTVDLDGGLGIAVQLAGGDWSVSAWQGDGYRGVGCGPDPAGTLSMAACPS